MKLEVKICGITRLCDAECAVEAGADYLGFVLVRSSKRFIAPEALAGMAELPVKKVGVFADAELDFIREMVETGRLDVVQLHGNETPEFARSIDFAEVWKASYDAGFPAARLVCDGPRGGSGLFGDHRKAAELAKLRPIMLAGGITPENAAELAKLVRPAGIDLAGGVESAPGIKDPLKIRQLFHNLKGSEL
ncbi:MAG: phosphoribosylanthranilate isomerase [Lentisphaeria bacterium]|nr:phosphoribosylanthranilate isomerase [Lentisphaeria bacterium]